MAPLFAFFVRFGAWLLRGLVAIAPYAVAKIAAGLGLAYVTNHFLLQPLLDLIHTSISNISAQKALDVIHAVGFDIAINAIFAAGVIKQASKISIIKKAAV